MAREASSSRGKSWELEALAAVSEVGDAEASDGVSVNLGYIIGIGVRDALEEGGIAIGDDERDISASKGRSEGDLSWRVAGEDGIV